MLKMRVRQNGLKIKKDQPTPEEPELAPVESITVKTEESASVKTEEKKPRKKPGKNPPKRKPYEKRTIWVGVRKQDVVCYASNVAQFRESVSKLDNSDEILAIQGQIRERTQRETFK